LFGDDGKENVGVGAMGTGLFGIWPVLVFKVMVFIILAILAPVG
jgi:hypothetical protein